MRLLRSDAIGEVLLPDGTWHPVKALRGEVVVWPPQGEVPIFEISLKDGSVITARADAVLATRAVKGEDLFETLERPKAGEGDVLARMGLGSTFFSTRAEATGPGTDRVTRPPLQGEV